ncbi:MAG: hypothetical protein QXP01_02625 [Candidatus Hadarchaeum sp.]
MNARHLTCLGLLLVMWFTIGCSAPATPAALLPTATPKPTATPLPTATPIPSPTPAGAVPMGFTADGAPYRGNPNAPVTLIEYGEFL